MMILSNRLLTAKIISNTKHILVFFLVGIIITCKGSDISETDSSSENETTSPTSYVPQHYTLRLVDHFDFFDPNNWSKGLMHDTDHSIRMIWNKNTGGENLLNDHYAGYLLDDNVYTKNGLLYLENRKQTVNGTNPIGEFDYSTGWINALQKINFNGTNKGVYIELRAKFPSGDKVWPAIWLIDDSTNRGWPPEIDIWEYFGRFFNTNRTDLMYMRYIYGLWNDKRDHSTAIEGFQAKYDATNQFHIYGFHWTESSMKWYIDGQLVHEKNKEIEIASIDWPDKTMCLVINNGLLNVVAEGNTIFPNALILDYIKVYEKEN